jgi:hypothetical protein
MYLDDTTLATGFRKARIETELVWDIASALAINRENSLCNAPYMREAKRLLRLFIAREGRYPHDCLEVENRFPGCLQHTVR